jgi:4-hydroxy-3-methylbut-2-enyl diphosphate reductase
MGVSRAVKMAEALAEQRNAPGGQPLSSIYTYGPLIHNTAVLRKLEEKKVFVLDEGATTDLRDALVIIRAHGVPPRVEAELREAGAVIKDATCPKVKANQLLAQKLCEKNDGVSPETVHQTVYRTVYRTVFLAGDRRHAEIQGILGYAPDCICVSNESEAEEAARRRIAGGNIRKDKAVLIGQTTFPVEDYRKIAAVLHKYFRLTVKNTICPATACRQDALRKLCASVDAMIIAGGKNSANTRALAGIAQSMGKPAFLLENAAEMKGIAAGLSVYTRIGLAAGASTPLETIDELEEAVLNI